jgi:hypothetical protein
LWGTAEKDCDGPRTISKVNVFHHWQYDTCWFVIVNDEPVRDD